MIITLSLAEVQLAAHVGIQRRIMNMKRGTKDSRNCDGKNGWTQDINGACGELAASIGTRRQWLAPVTWETTKPDLWPNIQVKTTPYRDGRLTVQLDAEDSQPYILVIGGAPVFKLCGWLYATDAKRTEWIDNPGGRGEAYFVPQGNHLRPVKELISWPIQRK